MKYIINKNRLNHLILKYLDNLDWWEWDIGDGEFDVADGRYQKPKLSFRIQYSFDVIYVSQELVSKLSKMFSIPEYDTVKIIIEWFNKKYNKSLTMQDFEWMDFEEENED